MYFRVYCNVREIEAPALETAEQKIRDSLRDFVWLTGQPPEIKQAYLEAMGYAATSKA